MVGVPVMVPVVESMDKPAGSPPADHVKLAAPTSLSVALIWTAVMAVPATLDWLPGLAR